MSETFPEKWKDYDNLLTKNIIWKQRTVGVGVMTTDEVLDWGWSGPMARGSGVDWDLRRDNPYSSYEDFDFDVPLGNQSGDTYYRYLVRMQEMLQSNRILRQALEKAAGRRHQGGRPQGEPASQGEGLHRNRRPDQSLPDYPGRHPSRRRGEIYQAIEAPKGEMGFYLISDGTAQPFRVKVRAPSFVVLNATNKLATGRLLADLIAIIGTMDIVLADVDR